MQCNTSYLTLSKFAKLTILMDVMGREDDNLF